jgi:acyl carrier protein
MADVDTQSIEGAGGVRSKDEIFGAIADILEKDFECPREKLLPEARLFQDLDLDSIDAIDLIVKLQNMADIKVSRDDFRQIQTLQDITEAVHRMLCEKTPD